MLNLRTDEIYLTRFLNCCEWNVTDAFIRMTKLFKLKVNVIVTSNLQFLQVFPLFQYENPKWFSNKKLTEYNDILKHNAKMMLSGRDKKGRRVYLSRMCKWRQMSASLNELKHRVLFVAAQAGNLNLVDLAQLDDLWFEAMLNEMETIENGIVVLVDMSGCV